jgi:hypothetical protein
MRKSNFALRLQLSIMEEAKEMARDEGVALNQLINIALAEKLAASRTRAFFARYTRDANVEQALALLHRPRIGEPPREGDAVPEGWARPEGQPARRKPRRPTRSKSRK